MSAIYILFPLTCILAMPACSRPGSVPERVVAGLVIYQFLLLAIGLLLGLSGHLTVSWYAASIGGATLLLAVRACRHGLHLPRFRAERYLQTRRGAATLLLAGLAIGVFMLELGFDIRSGTRHGDGLEYHIPRAIIWAWQGSFAAWPTPVAASIGLPVGADLVLLHQILLGRGWGGAGYVTLLLAAGATACVYLASLEFGMKRWQATMSALLFASFPAIGLRIWSVNSDLAAAFPALAAFVALHRIRNPVTGLAVFIFLNGMALACKPTVAPPLLVLAGVALWLRRRELASHPIGAPPVAAAIVGMALVLASYWPVYAAFGDFLGGDYSRIHRSATGAEFVHAVAMHAGYWLLEPLGYLTRFRELWESEALRSFYNALGARFATLPDIWKPYPGQDTGCTGLAAVLAVPVLFAGISTRWRGLAVVVFLLGALPLSGMIRPQPFFTRYNVLLLAGLALLWGGSGVFSKGRRRWLLVGITALNLGVLFGVVSFNIYLHATKWSQAGGTYYYLSDDDRVYIAESLRGRPLLVMTESSERAASLDALLPGPQVAFPLSYVVCPADGDWGRIFRDVAGRSNWLAFMHNGRNSIIPGPEYRRPGGYVCSDVPARVLEDALAGAGWMRYRQNASLDLWRHL